MIVKIKADKEKAKSLKKMAEITLERLKETDVIKYPTNTLDDYYDIVHGLMEAISVLMGIKIKGDGAHKELIDYIHKIGLITEKERIFLQEMREYRNKINYEGFMISSDYVINKEEIIKGIIKKLIQNLP